MDATTAADLAERIRRDDWSNLNVLVAHSKMAAELVSALRPVPGLRVGAVQRLDAGDVRDADVLIGYHFPVLSLAGQRKLRWLHLTGTGTDHLRAAGLRPDVLVTTSARVPVLAVAEYAVSGLLLLLKDLPEVITRRDPTWFSSNARLLAGSTGAVAGAGRIGRAVLRLLSGFGADTVAVTRGGEEDVPGATRTIGIGQLAAEAGGFDHLTVCLPGGPATRRVIGTAVLAALPCHAMVVNVGRAETIDLQSLCAALKNGRLGGAFLDVHEQEPLPRDDPIWRVPRLVISPHRAFAFPGERAEVAKVFLANLDDLRQGRTPRDLCLHSQDRI